MRVRIGALIVAVVIAIPLAGTPGASPQARAAQTPAAATAPKVEVWPPDAKALAERRAQAEGRALFRSRDVLPFTLTADFKAITRDRDPASTQTFPGTISYVETDGTTVSKEIRLRNRGHSRRAVERCDFPPIRLEFEKEAAAGTVFAGHRGLKLGTHCREVTEYEQYVVREYNAYRILNLITPESFRVRLAKVTYVDAVTKKPSKPRYGLFIEDDDDVAKRMDGRVTDQTNLFYTSFHPESATWLGLFEYMIGNTDVSIMAQHNVRTIETVAAGRRVVPYDFDYAGLVDTTYAVPYPAFGITTVRERLYRGPCRTAEDLEPYFAKLRLLKPDIYALYDQQADLSASYRKNAKNYLEVFYKMIDKPADVKKQLIDACKKTGM